MLTSPRCHRGAHAAHLEGELPEQDKSGAIPIPDMIKVVLSCACGSRPHSISSGVRVVEGRRLAAHCRCTLPCICVLLSQCRNRGAPSPGRAYQGGGQPKTSRSPAWRVQLLLELHLGEEATWQDGGRHRLQDGGVIRRRIPRTYRLRGLRHCESHPCVSLR